LVITDRPHGRRPQLAILVTVLCAGGAHKRSKKIFNSDLTLVLIDQTAPAVSPKNKVNFKQPLKNLVGLYPTAQDLQSLHADYASRAR
jgi:hypothetical protein